MKEHYLLSADVQLTMKIADLKLQLPDLTVKSLYLGISQRQLACNNRCMVNIMTSRGSVSKNIYNVQ